MVSIAVKNKQNCLFIVDSTLPAPAPPTALPPLLAASWPAAPLRDLEAALSSLSSHTPTWSGSQRLVSAAVRSLQRWRGRSPGLVMIAPKSLVGFNHSKKGESQRRFLQSRRSSGPRHAPEAQLWLGPHVDWGQGSKPVSPRATPGPDGATSGPTGASALGLDTALEDRCMSSRASCGGGGCRRLATVA